MSSAYILDLPHYSVTMSVYGKEKPQFLQQSINSILDQTHMTDDFIIVCDGKLTKQLDRVLTEAAKAHPDIIKIVRLKAHVGTACAANIAIEMCKNEYIGKMDSDDIALPTRFEEQLRRMKKYPQLDIIGSYLEEFDSETGSSEAIRKVPLSSDAIRRFSKRRNPFNNPTLLFKKSVALKAGGYSDELGRCEDYDFVVKMLDCGAVAGNIPKVLLRYRITKDNYMRRRNLANTKGFIAVRWKIYRSGYSSLMDFIIPCAAQLVLFVLPSSATSLIYKKVIR